MNKIVGITSARSAITSESLNVAWNRLLEKAGLDDKSHKWHELHFHTLRKYFQTQCQNAEVNRAYIEFWMGHKGEYLDDSYFRANLKEHINEYQKAIFNLSIYEVTPTISRAELDRAITRRVIVIQQTPDQALEEVATEYGITSTRLRNLLAKIKEKETETTGRLENIMVARKKEENSQQVINESELEEYLKKGWRFVASLNGEKVVIEK